MPVFSYNYFESMAFCDLVFVEKCVKEPELQNNQHCSVMNLSVTDFLSHFHVSYVLKTAFGIRFEG